VRRLPLARTYRRIGAPRSIAADVTRYIHSFVGSLASATRRPHPPNRTQTAARAHAQASASASRCSFVSPSARRPPGLCHADRSGRIDSASHRPAPRQAS
jgi:hypothetical protein